MLDQEWDVILIGAGQNNFALGTYLGMAGLKTVICESRLENGGRLASEEITMPGYWHNTLAYFQDNREISPVWKELKWDNGHHAEFVSPPVVSSLLLAEGRAISQHRSLADTVNSVARFSQKDAAAWRHTYDRYHRLIRDFLIPYYYQAPQSNGKTNQRIESEPAGKDFLRLWQTTPRQVVDELFENDAVKALVLSQMAIPRGVAMDYEGGGIEALKMIAGDENPELARGGAHDKGRATGVRLRDGREWKANLAVVSNVDPHSTFAGMVGEENLPKPFIERIKNIEVDEFSYFQVHLALKAPVRYALFEADDAAVGQAMNVNMGPESSADVNAMWQEIRAGELPQHACLHAICPTAFDPLQAPRSKHAASLFMPVPFQLKGKQPEDWVKLKNGFMQSILAIWRCYATNLTDDNIEMKVAMDPFYISGRWPNLRRGSVWVARKIAKQMGANRPIEELSGYRTPIQGLYQIGVATHPADAVIAGSGRNCWQVMKEDFKLQRERREP